MRKTLTAVLAMGLAAFAVTEARAADVPTFKQLDRELSFYRRQANLEGDANAQCSFNGLAYHCMFDMVLAVLNDPSHTKYADTRKAWDDNHAKFKQQAPMVAIMMGRLIPLMVMADSRYARDFADGAKAYAPRFNPDDYVHPLPVEIGTAPESRKVAWFDPAADADNDGISNKDELLAIAPNWEPAKDAEARPVQGSGKGVTEDERKRFLDAALDKAPATTPPQASAPTAAP